MSLLCMDKDLKKDTIQRQLDRHMKYDATVTWILQQKNKVSSVQISILRNQ
jgi:hypothetical protein